jgi:hypothetical protein
MTLCIYTHKSINTYKMPPSSDSPPRGYGGRLAKTRSVALSVRSPINVVETKEVDKQRRKHISSHDTVWKFVPDVDMHCCIKKICMADFESADDPRVVAARKPLFNTSICATQRKVQLFLCAWYVHAKCSGALSNGCLATNHSEPNGHELRRTATGSRSPCL